MQSAIIFATLALAFGAPLTSDNIAQQKEQTEQAMTGYQGAMTNARQVQDTLNRQLKEANGDPHANADRLVAFITSADSQIDNAIATISDALAPLTLGASKAVGDFLLGPFVQSVTNGAEVLVANLLGGGADVVDDALVGQITGDYSKLISLSKNNGVNVSKLENLNNQISKTVAGKSKRDTVTIPEFVKSAITNAKQTIETMTEQLEKGDGHAAKDVVNAAITGLDSQVDNLADLITKDLNGVTLGISGEIGDFLLGPIFQSATNGAEVIISNIVGGGIDMVTDGAVKTLSSALSNLHSLGNKVSMSTSKMDALEKVQKQVSEIKTAKKHAATKGKRDSDTVTIPEFVKSAITNAKQTIETMTEQLEKGDGHAAKDVVNAAITGLDSQVDNLADLITKDLNGVTLGISGEIGDFLLGPIFQSATNGAEVIISNIVGGGIDMVTDGAVKTLSSALSNLHSLGNKVSMSTSKMDALEKVQKQVSEIKASKKQAASHKAKPSGSSQKRASDQDLSGVNGSVTNYKQVLDTLTSQLKSHNGHAAQATINAFITGADSQIDNAIATVSDALAPYTLGLSKAIGNVLLGPFVQSVTNGAEVLISNLLGGGIDGVADTSIEAYTKSIEDLTKLAEKYNIDDSALKQVQQRLAAVTTKSN